MPKGRSVRLKFGRYKGSVGKVFPSEGRDLGDLSVDKPSFEDAMLLDMIRSMRKDRRDRDRRAGKAVPREEDE